MTEKVPCPYCGAEMELSCYFVIRSRKYATRNRFVCKECDAYAPSGDSEKNAIAAALRRYTPPIKPLTLEEVSEHVKDHDAAPLWYQEIHSDLNSEWVLADTVSQWIIEKYVSWYGKTWRCWERKPTEEEMEAAAWEK